MLKTFLHPTQLTIANILFRNGKIKWRKYSKNHINHFIYITTYNSN